MYFSNDNMLNQILTDLNVGWWKINFANRQIHFSDFAKDLLKLNSNDIPLDDFLNMVRKDYREGLLQAKRDDGHIGLEKTFPLLC